MTPATAHPFTYLDLSDITTKRPAATARLRADYLLGACDAYLRLHGDQALIILLSPMLADVAGLLRTITLPENITIEIEPTFRALKAGVQGSV